MFGQCNGCGCELGGLVHYRDDVAFSYTFKFCGQCADEYDADMQLDKSRRIDAELDEILKSCN